MKPLPFRVIRKDGFVHVDRMVDEAFRKALMDGVPVSLRSKMREALAAIPNAQTRAHTKRYFGAELPTIIERIGPLLIQLNRVCSESFNLPGLFEWLEVTGLGDDYRMVKVFDAWAQLKRG